MGTGCLFQFTYFEIYTLHYKFSNFLCFAFLCAHLRAVPINFNYNDENRILGK